MSSFQYYVEDLLDQLIHNAVERKHNANSDLETGILQGYYECISSALNQAEAFGITEELPKKVREFIPESLFDRSA